MKLSFNHGLELLTDALQILCLVCGGKNLAGILKQIKVITKENVLLQATDCKLSVSVTLPQEYCEIVERGECLLPGKKVLQILKTIQSDSIDIEGTDKIYLKYPNGQYKILAGNTAAFPEIPAFAPGLANLTVLPTSQVIAMVRQTIFASTMEKTRYDLDNILIKVFTAHGYAQSVATDGKRCAIYTSPIEVVNDAPEIEALVPATHLVTIAKILGITLVDKTEIVGDKKKLFIRAKNVEISSILSEATFPPYQKVFPKKFPIAIPVTIGQMINSLQCVQLLTDSSTDYIVMSISDSKISFDAESYQGTASRQMELFSGNPADCSIKLNPKYLLDALLVCPPGDEATLHLINEKSMLKLECGNLVYGLLPIKVEEEEQKEEENK